MKYTTPAGALEANGSVVDEQLYQSGVTAAILKNAIDSLVKRESQGKKLPEGYGPGKRWMLGNTLIEFREWCDDYLLGGLLLSREHQERLKRTRKEPVNFSGNVKELDTIVARSNHLTTQIQAIEPGKLTLYTDLIASAGITGAYAALELSKL